MPGQPVADPKQRAFRPAGHVPRTLPRHFGLDADDCAVLEAGEDRGGWHEGQVAHRLHQADLRGLPAGRGQVQSRALRHHGCGCEAV